MSISLSQYIDKIKAMSNMLLLADKPVQLASGSALFEFSKRVFQTGESTTGGKFQYNSTTPLYVNPATTFGSTSKLKPIGKNGQTKFKSGKNHKTAYVASYKELRSIVGRESSFVNWEATGDLKSEIENRVNNTPTTRKFAEAEYTIQTVSKENSGKLKGFATKYVGVFKISESEKKTYYNALENELLKQIDESLK